MSKNQNDISYQKYLFHRGENYRSYEFLGAFPDKKKKGVLFRVWAPRARAISLVWEGNGWQPGADSFARVADDDSLWECFVPDMKEGDLYKFAVEGSRGGLVYKDDPYGLETESPIGNNNPQRASVVYGRDRKYRWQDSRWMKERAKRNPYRSPMNIYEVQLGSWKRREDGSYMSYKDAARELIPYAKKMGFTHLELLPVTEYPYDGSWGYQVTGYFSVTARYGKPDELKYLIDEAHKNDLGVILDWVPAHFPKDAHGLIEFDGEPLYEDSNPFRMEHKGWGTRAFDFGRPEVKSFLVSSADYFCREFHADGIRVDAISAMLYLDYGRPDGEWMQNQNGGRENLEAIDFLHSLNEYLLSTYPGVLSIAEESTAWPMVTKPPKDGGLGFNFKWNMGWMNDTLAFFKEDFPWRGSHHYNLTFAMTYTYSENFILPISHDEVVHGKGSLVNKMPGTYEQKFDGGRSFYVYFLTHPGKKLSFMGNEFAQLIEWNENQGLDWMLLDYELHRKYQLFVRDLNHIYLENSQLWEGDDRIEGFRWIDADNTTASVYSYYREDPDHPGRKLLVILNYSGLDYQDFWFGVPDADYWRPLIDSDAPRYGGRGLRTKRKYRPKKGECNNYNKHISMTLPARSGIILVSEEDDKK